MRLRPWLGLARLFRRPLATSRSIQARSRSRFHLEALESRLAPAVKLALDTTSNPGVFIYTLTDSGGPPVAVQVNEQLPNRLEITLNGTTFSADSSLDPGQIAYNVPLTPTASNVAAIDLEQSPNTGPNVQFQVDLGGYALTFGGIDNLNGYLRSLTVSAAQTIDFTGVVDTTHVPTGGGGNVSMAATQSITFQPGSGIVTSDGSITLRANELFSATPGAGGSEGIVIDGATLQTLGVGNIDLLGHGAANAPTNDDLNGIAIFGSSLVQALRSGNVKLDGKSGIGDDGSDGVEITEAGTTVSTASGNLTILGCGQGSGSWNDGVQISEGATVTAGGTGSLTIEGIWTSGSGNNTGVKIRDNTGTSPTRVTTEGGPLTITSTSSDPGQANTGIEILSNTLVATAGGGTLTLEDKGGQGIYIEGMVQTGNGTIRILATQGPAFRAGAFTGVEVNAGTIQSSTGPITLDGKGGIDPTFSGAWSGVAIINNSDVQTGGSAGITLNGVGGFGAGPDFGVGIDNSIISAAGAVVITGAGGAGAAGGNDGVNIANVGAILGRTIRVTGTPGLAGANPSVGINLPNALLTAHDSIDLVADSISLAPPSKVVAVNKVTVRPTFSSGGKKVPIALGAAIPGLHLLIDNAFVSSITTQSLYIGDANSGNIVVAGVFNLTPKFTNLFLETGAAVVQNPNGRIIVPNLAIKSVLGVGTAASPLLTTVLKLAISGGSGGVFVNNTGNLDIAPILTQSGITTTLGNISLTTSGRLNVLSNITTTGNGSINLVTTDAGGAGQDLNVGLTSTIQTDRGAVILRAGDNLALGANAKITTKNLGTITLSVDFNSADANVGGVANVLGNLFGTRAFFTGNGDWDNFYITASLTTPMTVTGGNGNNRLTVYLPSPTIQFTGGLPTFGNLRFGSNYQMISYTQIGVPLGPPVTVIRVAPPPPAVKGKATGGTTTTTGGDRRVR